ncbi:uncharacterized protein LOC123542602 [Mercenaria mercenaria]|uniref:uncharacterized protein LOC123542602 n=1 Tax=Mercenaria mercenaria TaxID=6596 RepID=UPI00234F60D7|nr:uncharacterized protein LOC123542602 [Mercenaria mercenaria]
MYFDTAKYGEGTGPILTRGLYCSEEQDTVNSCNLYGPYRPVSSHMYDLSIACTPCGLPDIYNGYPVAFNGTELTVTCHTGFYPTQIKMKCLKNHSWSEEQRCTPYHAFPLNISEIRLSHFYDGRVEILVNGTWGTICDTNFDSADARVICKKFGLESRRYFIKARHHSGRGSGPIYVNKLNCTGTEPHINLCSYEISNNCTHYDDAAVECTGFSGIRLSDGPSFTQGRIELKILDTWGTVCDDGFGMQEANAICSMLGYPPAVTYYAEAHYGPGTGLILVDDLSCEEDATHINNCTYTTDENCDHNEDVSVVCTDCTAFDNCTTCPSGKYGSSCQHECGLGCRDRVCDITSGSCACLSNFQGDRCDQCVNGKYGNTCDIDCSAGCSNDACNSNGDCYGCKTGFTGNMCTQCVYGKYGTDCDIACPFGCSNGTCKDNGDCHGCKAGFTGKMCTQCEYGKYGTDCDIACPLGCNNGTCKDNGDCHGCKAGFTGKMCTQCEYGKYGTDCDIACPLGCNNGTCKDNGDCHGCKAGFTGKMCTQCEYGKYGTDCDIACPFGCNNGTCKDNGDCHGCKAGFVGSKCEQCVDGMYGINCEHDCSKHCALGTCIKTTGVCNDGCRINFYGEQCNMTCATTCLPDGKGRQCFYSNGSCVKDCQDGYHGDMCQDRCSENCIETVCTKANGGCKFGCVDGFKGKGCTKSISDSDNTADSLIVGTVIGACVGSVAALLVVWIVIMIRRHLRRGHLSRHAPEQTYELKGVKQKNVRLDASENKTSKIEHTPELAAVKQDNVRLDASQTTTSNIEHTYEVADVEEENTRLDVSQNKTSIIEHTYEVADVEEENTRLDVSQNETSTRDSAFENTSDMAYEELGNTAKSCHLYERIGGSNF